MDVDPFKRAFVHELKKNLDFAVVIEHIMTPNNVRVVDITENLDLTAHLESDRVLVVTIDNFESIEPSGGSV